MKQLLDMPMGITTAQEMLLKAALYPPDQALEYWDMWKKIQKISAVTITQQDVLPKIFDPLDNDSQRLLPVVYRNLEKSGDPVISTLRGIYRYTWMKGNHFLSQAIEFIGPLQKAGFDTMLVKGMPLALLYYKNFGLRPLEDIDIFVPLKQSEDVIQFLTTNFKLKFDERENELRKMKMSHALHFANEKGTDFDLHWHFHSYNLNEVSDQPMWDKKVPLLLSPEVTTYTLSPTHQLYRNFTHCYSWLARNPHLRWIPDSLIILKEAGDQIDWDDLFELAGRQNFILPVCSMLRYLKANFDVQYPAEVSAYLDTLQGSSAERYYFNLLLKAQSYSGTEWSNFPNKVSRVLLRYYLYQERDVRNSFPIWIAKRIKFNRIHKQL